MAGARPVRGARRGATTTSAVLALAAGGLVVGGLVVFGPRWSGAAESAADATTSIVARDPEHRKSAELIGALVAQSREVLRIAEPGATRFTEIVLWLEDAGRPGTIELEEIAVVSHSELLGTVVLHHVPRSAANGEARTLDQVLAPDFPDRLRTPPGATRRVLATGVRRLEASARSGNDGPAARIRLRLDWGDDRADEVDASVLEVEAVMRRRRPTGDHP